MNRATWIKQSKLSNDFGSETEKKFSILPNDSEQSFKLFPSSLQSFKRQAIS